MRPLLYALLALSPWLLAPAPVTADAPDQGRPPQIFPNPVKLSGPESTDQRLHIDQVEPGSTAEIFNMIGERVITLNLKGNPQQDSWDCVNANGVAVMSWIYVVLIQQPSGKKSVQRAAILK